MSDALSSDRRKTLRRIGHHLQPVVTVGDGGLSEGVIKEVERALEDHELIKVRLPAADREDRATLARTLCEQCGATLVQTIGRIALIVRPAEEPDPRKSNLLRHPDG